MLIGAISGNRTTDFVKGFQSAMREFLTLNSAADELGCSLRTVRRMISSGQLPAYRIGKTNIVRVKRSDLNQVVSPVIPDGKP
ncbi:helix-turn-helix domain-containing protein [Mycobacterium malmoense]|uniref:helix-turn-helix domain-containing protein n=1 Tax=Mycobacterium malmoense TaxID=1780 RepID=UPI0009F48E7C|nr:helix-turn-helix domain-containing protein [Mycobacterium malmoense]